MRFLRTATYTNIDPTGYFILKVRDVDLSQDLVVQHTVEKLARFALVISVNQSPSVGISVDVYT